jgi:hypothetical protein
VFVHQAARNDVATSKPEAMATPAIGALLTSIDHAWSLNLAARDFPLDVLIDVEKMAVGDNIFLGGDRKRS